MGNNYYWKLLAAFLATLLILIIILGIPYVFLAWLAADNGREIAWQVHVVVADFILAFSIITAIRLVD